MICPRPWTRRTLRSSSSPSPYTPGLRRPARLVSSSCGRREYSRCTRQTSDVRQTDVRRQTASLLNAGGGRTSCAGGRHNMPRPCDLDLWPFDLESGVRVTCDVGYHCANFSLPRHLCSRLRPDLRDRQTSDRQTDRQMSSDKRCQTRIMH